MCSTCDRISLQLITGPLSEAATKRAFAQIALAVSRGVDYDHFERVINLLLGTTLAPRDEEAETRWEKSHR